MLFWYCIVLLLPILFAVDQQSGHVTALEGGLVTLSCNYTTSSPSPDLFWYIQLTSNSPQYVLRRDRYSEGRSNSDEFKKRFDSRLNFTSSSVPLTIQRLQLSDSAVYYCALKPAVMTSDSVTVQKHIECSSFRQCDKSLTSVVGVMLAGLYTSHSDTQKDISEESECIQSEDGEINQCIDHSDYDYR
uniref:T-cell receptor alpha/delta variable 31.0 n=1 Tax=Salmo trutta TaxID=8032 RepID=A0A674F3G8_SALTR